ncbi:hypothetical protein HDU97_006654 [Phlyctochytrium planicorne]|nr:hypothetical protein HDU97_006654 [Phlyctochytrium planicorne]
MDDDPIYYDNTYWRESIPEIDLLLFDDLPKPPSPSSTDAVRHHQTIQQVPNFPKPQPQPPAPATVIIHQHHHHHHHHQKQQQQQQQPKPPSQIEPQPLQQPIVVAPLPSTAVAAPGPRVTLVPYGDAWVTKAEYERLVREQEREEHERALNDLQAEREKREQLERAVAKKEWELRELRVQKDIDQREKEERERKLLRELEGEKRERDAERRLRIEQEERRRQVPVVVAAPPVINFVQQARPPPGPPPPANYIPATVHVIHHREAPPPLPAFTGNQNNTLSQRQISAPHPVAQKHQPQRPTSNVVSIHDIGPIATSIPPSAATSPIQNQSGPTARLFDSQPQDAIIQVDAAVSTSTNTSTVLGATRGVTSTITTTAAKSTQRNKPFLWRKPTTPPTSNPDIVFTPPTSAPGSPRDSTWTRSDATLHLQTSLSSILPEAPFFTKPSKKDVSLKEKLKDMMPQDGKEETVVGNKQNRWIVRGFRYFNLTRSVGTACLGIYEAGKTMNDPFTIALKGQGLMIALIIFNIVDLLVAFIKAFPRVLWFFWDVKDWDPLVRVYSIWSIIADHELLTDIAPVLVNVILKIYSYRLDEIRVNPNASGTIWLTVLYIILFHAGRLFRVLAFTKKATLLGLLVVIKAILLCWDIMTNSLLLYATLVSLGASLFHHSLIISLLLSIIIPSSIVTLSTNVLVNFPMHYLVVRMQVRGAVDEVVKNAGGAMRNEAEKELGEWMKGGRIWKTAVRKTFQPLAVFGTYILYALPALFRVLVLLNYITYSTPLDTVQTLLPNSTFFGWNNQNATGVVSENSVMVGIVWVNVLANYSIGAVAALGYWVGVVGYGMVGGGRGVDWVKGRVWGRKREGDVKI